MKTAEKKAAAVQGTAKANGVNTAAANKTNNRPSLTGREVKQGANDDQSTDDAQKAPQTENKAAEAKSGSSARVGDQSANADQPAGEKVGNGQAETKAEVKYIKPAPNLEQTLKSVSELHRLTIQRLALIGRIRQLEDFEIQLQEDGDELESNPYTGCKLIIEDDKRRQFITVTPGLIRMVAQYVFNACHEKLAEIEAHIVFPNA